MKITAGNTDDRKPFEAMVAELEGKMFADKGYISKALFQRLWQRGLHLITGIRRNMKNYLLPLLDKILLRKRFIIETLFDKLKSGMGLEHTRHRSPTNAFVHILSCVVAYILGAAEDQNGENCRPRRHSEHFKRNMSLSRTRVDKSQPSQRATRVSA